MQIKFMGLTIDTKDLATKDEVVNALGDRAAFVDLDEIRERYRSIWGDDLTWRYPISDGSSAGAIIVPVQEGFLWLPYNEVDPELMELVSLSDIELLDHAGADVLHRELDAYAEGLLNTLKDICAILENYGNHNEN